MESSETIEKREMMLPMSEAISTFGPLAHRQRPGSLRPDSSIVILFLGVSFELCSSIKAVADAVADGGG